MKKSEPKTKKTQLTRLEKLSSITLKTDLPDFKFGDKIIVKQKIKEGDKFRVQNFEGIVIARNGRGVNETFTVRKVSSGVGVERVFPLHSPMIAGIEVKVAGFVRRAKLYYLRELEGKASRIRDKKLKLSVAQSGSAAKA